MFVCCLDEECCTGCYWCLGDARVLYSGGFLCVSSHYLILPRVSSLAVQGLGVSSPTPKAQADLWSGTKIPEVVCYGSKGK